MAQAQEAQLSPETVLEEMKKNGVTHVVWLPDSETNWLYLLMQADPSLHLIAGEPRRTMPSRWPPDSRWAAKPPSSSSRIPA